MIMMFLVLMQVSCSSSTSKTQCIPIGVLSGEQEHVQYRGQRIADLQRYIQKKLQVPETHVVVLLHENKPLRNVSINSKKFIGKLLTAVIVKDHQDPYPSLNTDELPHWVDHMLFLNRFRFEWDLLKTEASATPGGRVKQKYKKLNKIYLKKYGTKFIVLTPIWIALWIGLLCSDRLLYFSATCMV